MAGCAPFCLHPNNRDDADAVMRHTQRAISHVAFNALFQISTIKREQQMKKNLEIDQKQFPLYLKVLTSVSTFYLNKLDGPILGIQ